VTIDVHGPLDRVKDVSFAFAFETNRKVPAHGWRRADNVPLLGVQRAPIVAGAPSPSRKRPRRSETDRPRSPFRRRPAKGAAILETGCFPPPRFAGALGIAPSSFPRRPPAHAAHTFSPSWGKVPFGHCKFASPGRA